MLHLSATRAKRYTDKKEKNFFFIYKKIQKGAVAKSYMTNGLLIYEFATAPIWISLYMRKIVFSFLSVYLPHIENKKDWERGKADIPLLVFSDFRSGF
jgi:hypothetical protein